MQKTLPIIAFLGPDGVGKSTIVEELKRTFSAAQVKSIFIHHRSRGQAKPKEEVILHHEAPPHSLLLSIGKVIFRFITRLREYHLGRLRKMRKGDVLIFQDRPYFYDMAIDPLRYRYDGPIQLVWILAKLSPQADVYIVLDAPIDILLARKQEIPKKELARQRKDYLALTDILPNSHVINTDQSLQTTTNEIAEIITSYLT